MTLATGILGAAVILVLFILNQAQKVSNKSLWYDLGNFLGSFLLMLYAYLLFSIPFLILNGVWALVSLKDVVADLRTQRNA